MLYPLNKHFQSFWIEICQDKRFGLEEVRRNFIFPNFSILYFFHCFLVALIVCQFVSDFAPHFLRFCCRDCKFPKPAPILSTMGLKTMTQCIMLASIFFSLSSCAPLKLQEENEDPDIYRNVVRWVLFLKKTRYRIWHNWRAFKKERLDSELVSCCFSEDFQVLNFFGQSTQLSDTFCT